MCYQKEKIILDPFLSYINKSRLKIPYSRLKSSLRLTTSLSPGERTSLLIILKNAVLVGVFISLLGLF